MSKIKKYKISSSDFLVFDHNEAMQKCLTLLRDGQGSISKDEAEGYFKDAYCIFQNNLRKLEKLKRNLTQKEEKELELMLEILIDTKKSLYE